MKSDADTQTQLSHGVHGKSEWRNASRMNSSYVPAPKAVFSRGEIVCLKIEISNKNGMIELRRQWSVSRGARMNYSRVRITHCVYLELIDS
jgi:hypothetical protein